MNREKILAGLRLLDEKRRRFEEARYDEHEFLDWVFARSCKAMGIGYFRLLEMYASIVVPWRKFKKGMSRLLRW